MTLSLRSAQSCISNSQVRSQLQPISQYVRGSDDGIRALKVGCDPLFRARKQNNPKRNTSPRDFKSWAAPTSSAVRMVSSSYLLVWLVANAIEARVLLTAI